MATQELFLPQVRCILVAAHSRVETLTSVLPANDHARMRKIMNPAFTSARVRSFLPLLSSFGSEGDIFSHCCAHIQSLIVMVVAQPYVEGSYSGQLSRQSAIERVDLDIEVHTGCHRRRYHMLFQKCGHELNHPIFLVAFDVDCGALDDNLNPMMQAYRNML